MKYNIALQLVHLASKQTFIGYLFKEPTPDPLTEIEQARDELQTSFANGRVNHLTMFTPDTAPVFDDETITRAYQTEITVTKKILEDCVVGMQIIEFDQPQE